MEFIDAIGNGVLKIICGLLIIGVYLSLTNKAQAQNQTPIDFMGNFVLGGIIGGVLYSNTISLGYYIVYLIAALATIHALNTLIARSQLVHRWVMGRAVPIIRDGKLITEAFSGARTRVDLVEVMAQLRAQGIFSLADVDYAQKEADGTLTVVRRSDKHEMNFLLARDGIASPEQLARIGRDQAWLEHTLASRAQSLGDTFAVELSQGELMTIVRTDGSMKRYRIPGAITEESE